MMYLPFATCLRIRYAPEVAARLGYTDVDEPESRLAVSFMHAATPRCASLPRDMGQTYPITKGITTND